MSLAEVDEPIETHEDALKRLGEKIRQRRKAKQWSQLDLADHAGVQLCQVSEIERGLLYGLHHVTVLKILCALDLCILIPGKPRK